MHVSGEACAFDCDFRSEGNERTGRASPAPGAPTPCSPCSIRMRPLDSRSAISQTEMIDTHKLPVAAAWLNRSTVPCRKFIQLAGLAARSSSAYPAGAGRAVRSSPSSRSAFQTSPVGPTMSPRISPVPRILPKMSGISVASGSRRATGLPRFVMMISRCFCCTSSSSFKHLALNSPAGISVRVDLAFMTGHFTMVTTPPGPASDP